jgi:hypothetical protein
MLVPVGLDDRDEKTLRFVCGLSTQSVEHVTVATAVGDGQAVPAAERRPRARRLAVMAALQATVTWISGCAW